VKKTILNNKGFTLIELTTAIVIVSILSVLAGMGLVQIANGYRLAKDSTAAAEQAQVALCRISKELSWLETISSPSVIAITYKRFGPSEQLHTLAWTSAGQPLKLDGDILIDKVQSFSLTYRDTYGVAASSYSSSTAVIEIMFELKGYNNIALPFVQRVGI
jgi:prepilin-type N-terminal cleavage/methylation domain-containing protein